MFLRKRPHRGSKSTQKWGRNTERKQREKPEMQIEHGAETAKGGPRLQKRRRVKIALPTTATLDLRTRAGKLFVATRDAIIADLGGRDELSRAELELVDRAAGLATRLNAADAELLEGQPTSLAASEYSTLCNALNRILTTLGLKRRPKEIRSLREQIIAGSRA